jgi:tetratricopeptide (TPR) repeat protein
VVEAEGVRTTVHLREGRVVFAEGGILRDTLGRMLLRRGRLREDQYLAVIERMSRSETSIRVGEVLIELGILSPREVYEALKLQVREKVVACFEWRTFEANFRRGEALPPHATSFECPPVEALILTGMRAHFDADRLEPVLAPHAHRHAALRDSPRHVAERFHMDPGEQRLLLAISGERSLASLTDEGRLDPLATKRVLAALLVTGSLELLDAPRSLAGAGVSSARSADPAQAAAPASAGSADGDSGARARARPGLRAPAASSPPPRPGPARELDPKQAGLEAEHAFGQGRRFLRENLPAQALAELRRAAELQPHEAEYQMYAAWAAAPLERDEGAKLLARATARAFAVRVLRQDRGHARAHAILGQLLYEEDEREAAERHFRIAVQSDPEELEAQRWLRHMERKRPRKRGTGH